MADYTIRFSDEADEHLDDLTARQRARILDAVEEQLLHEPTKITRNRKPMQPDRTPFIAPWECLLAPDPTGQGALAPRFGPCISLAFDAGP